MKLSVLTDQSGRILATQHKIITSPTIPLPPPKTMIVPSEGQLLHEVEIPSELYKHILENTLAQEIFKYKIEHHDEIATLVKLS